MGRLYSVIIPVYNRPDEVRELIDSLTGQTYTHFEVIIVEDGSTNRCEEVVRAYQNRLDIRYFYKENSGQGFSRNYGFSRAKGDYYIVFDSDCIIPEYYFERVEKSLNTRFLDAFGGPDKAHPAFNDLQKAISYSMTSLFTTGGIRGAKKHVGQFHPRSFNMGISKEVYEKTEGYIITRMGEDIEFSIRIHALGFKIGLIHDAYVYHKRRTSLKQFYKQLHFFGRARINVFRFFRSEIKIIHLFPALFTLSFWVMIILLITDMHHTGGLSLVLFLLYYILIFFDSLVRNRNIRVALMSVPTSFVQLYAYGVGFLTELCRYVGGETKASGIDR